MSSFEADIGWNASSLLDIIICGDDIYALNTENKKGKITTQVFKVRIQAAQAEQSAKPTMQQTFAKNMPRDMILIRIFLLNDTY